jgi:hypothetical protein
MELEKRTQSTAVEKLSQNDIVQTLAVKKFDKVSETLPKKIQGTFELPKIREMVLATSEKNVCGFLEFELIKLAERVNVSGNLTDGQIEFIASQLVGMYPNETIADFKICFEKGSSGAYGKIFKLDGVEVGNWMKAYLDEKYQVMEAELMKEKDDQYKRVSTNTDWLKLWAEAVAKTDTEGRVKTQSRNITFLQHLRSITPKEIHEEGQVEPKEKPYKGYLTIAEQQARRMLTKAASEFYLHKRGGFDLKKFEAPFIANGIEFTVEFMAETEQDAILIYNNAVGK